MKCLITGHRLHKLESYDLGWIRTTITETLGANLDLVSYGYSGMASGVDLWFCSSCQSLNIPYAACIPFDEQGDTMDEGERDFRQSCIDKAAQVIKMKNSLMVEKADMGIIVWDGNKGGTHNVVQQLVEHRKPFIWINPVARKVWHCT